MPRKKIGTQRPPTRVQGKFAEQLAAELNSGRESGQPLIYEQEFSSGKVSVTVIWDEWARLPFDERTAVIHRAYELAEGRDCKERIVLASGLTVPQAHEAGMLPYQIIPALRRNDPVTLEQAHQAFLEEGASQLVNSPALQLRFATEEEAQACQQRLIRRFPGSDDVWIINREITAQDFAAVREWAEAE